MSARSWRAAREGDTRAASRTSESFIIGIGASGALLAGAAIGFITLVGLVSFNAWPSSSNPLPNAANVGLSAAKPEPPPAEPGSLVPGLAPGSVAPVRTAAGLFASKSGAARGAGDGAAAGGRGGHGGGPVAASAGSAKAGSAPTPPATASTSPPSSTGGSNEGPGLRIGEPVGGEPSGAVEGPNGRSDSRSQRDHPTHSSSGQTRNGGGNGNGGGKGNGNGGGNGNGNGGGNGKAARQAHGHTKASGPKSKH